MKLEFYSSLLVAIFGILFFGFNSKPDGAYRQLQQQNFKAGESYEYRVKMGFLNIGEASVELSPTIVTLTNRACYRINVNGRTTGISDLFKIRNTYRSFIDTSSILPLKFFMQANEGDRYQKTETISFDHDRNTASSDINTSKKQTQKVPNNIQDVISGFYYLRTLDYSKYNKGDVISNLLYFDQDILDFKVKYGGRYSISTKFGKINAIKLIPQMPPNKMFSGEEAIRIWVSDDINHVPLKIEVDFLIGGASMELRKYSGVKTPFSWR